MQRDVTNVTGQESRVMELVRQRLDSLSPAERKLARVLLASYPIAGLESVVRFAERARVSPPTVTRFITKLGFSGYPEFQETLRNEVQARPRDGFRAERFARGRHPQLENHARRALTSRRERGGRAALRCETPRHGARRTGQRPIGG